MKKTFSNSLFFILLGLVFFIAVLINNLFLKGVNADLTQDNVYSLSQGSSDIVESLDEPINLYFFFSDTSSKGMTAIRDYASQVESLLREYERQANGKINLEVIDPVPFSEAEDRAASFGLTAANTGVGQDTVYFGLAGTNALDDGMIIGFFDPQKESFLEYDISKLIYQLSEPELIKLTLITDIQVAGGQSPITGQGAPPNAMYQQLQSFFEVSLLSSSDTTLPAQTDVLMLLHPQNIAPQLMVAIDQYLMDGGKAIMLIDPHYESDQMAQMGSVGANSSQFSLLEHYGIKVNTTDVVLDALTGLEVRAGNGGVVRHLGFLGLANENVDDNDITTAGLESINGASFGSLALMEDSQLSQTNMLLSSFDTALMPANDYASKQDPTELNQGFSNQQQQHVLAARFNGKATSILSADNVNSTEYASFQTDAFTASTDNLNVVVIADADITADRFWVQQSSFFGQTVFSPFANNADLISNVVENSGGSEGLIGIRSRGTFARPFTRVQAIQVVAEEKFREQEQLLQVQLEQTEAQLMQLTQLQNQSDSLTLSPELSPEQQQAIDDFTQQKISIRKSLRDVQFQLDKDINALGNTLKLINIVVAPLVLVLLLFFASRLLRKKHKPN